MKAATEKQKQSRQRNWEIFRLRGLYSTLGGFQVVSPAHIDAIRKQIDAAIVDMGGLSNEALRERKMEELINGRKNEKEV